VIGFHVTARHLRAKKEGNADAGSSSTDRRAGQSQGRIITSGYHDVFSQEQPVTLLPRGLSERSERQSQPNAYLSTDSDRLRKLNAPIFILTSPKEGILYLLGGLDIIHTSFHLHQLTRQHQSTERWHPPA
jgi:hypothetical protein